MKNHNYNNNSTNDTTTTNNNVFILRELHIKWNIFI